jgi:asparagine synthase (glutamine-hydrolysing)
MCGISVFITTKDHKDLLNNNITHRGPDNTITYSFDYLTDTKYKVILTFHRLAIIDIDNGNQPFVYKKGDHQVYLLCNGEIYNYKQLIEKYNLTTKSDCHTILDLYLKIGIKETVKELDGEFAFVLIDIIGNVMNIYYVRDRFGIRPLFYYFDSTGYYFSSELKGIPFNGRGTQVEPRKIHNIEKMCIFGNEDYYKIGEKKVEIKEDLSEQIRNTLIQSVKDRMQSERPLGALLSGGLDSSLVAGIASKLLAEQNKRLTTFSIGMDSDSPDIKYARKVAEHINSIHHEIIIPVDVWIENLKNVIYQIETYDITTIRASTGQYLLAKWISENTDIKVLLNGDGADELESGYLYFYNTPNPESAHNENLRLLENIHYYDVLRVDRGISAWGLEARVPFLSKDFVDLYLSIDNDLRHPLKDRIEKYLVRKAFDSENLIPSDVLWRKKEAFSDGVSDIKKSWFEYIHDFVETQVTDKEFEIYKNETPSKEAYWYKKNYKSDYFYDNFIGYWMPNWSKETKDPSARVLKIH